MRKIVSTGKVIDEGKTRKAKVRFGKLDNFDVGVIRRIIHNLYRENISPSLKKILLQLNLQLHDAIYRLRFYSKSLSHILSLTNSHNNVPSIQKNRADKSHRVIVALKKR